MKKIEGESYEEWTNRVQMYEKGIAMQRIAEGKPIEEVLEQMSRRITEKLLHPIYNALKSSNVSNHDFEASRKSYEEKMKNVGKAADHVLDENLIDKNE